MIEILEDIAQKEKECTDLLKYISKIVNNLIDGELTMTDVIAEEERLKNTCKDLQQICKEIIDLRLDLALELSLDEI